MLPKYIFCILFLLYSILDSTEGRCKCGQSITHYEELGCTPVYDKPEDCCPSHYDCDEIIRRMTNTTSCYFNNKEYKNREYIASELTARSCLAGCRCNRGDGFSSEDFVCAHIDCPEFMGAKPKRPECISQYTFKSCCTSGTVCPPFNNLATCKVDGKTYYEGQTFIPESNECLTCICQKGFKGKFEEPFCRPVACNTGLKSSKVRKYCAPIYFRCCAYDWLCMDEEKVAPAEDEYFVFEDYYEEPEDKKEVKATANACRLGNELIKKGEKFTKKRHNANIKCQCIIPPFVTCTE